MPAPSLPHAPEPTIWPGIRILPAPPSIEITPPLLFVTGPARVRSPLSELMRDWPPNTIGPLQVLSPEMFRRAPVRGTLLVPTGTAALLPKPYSKSASVASVVIPPCSSKAAPEATVTLLPAPSKASLWVNRSAPDPTVTKPAILLLPPSTSVPTPCLVSIPPSVRLAGTLKVLPRLAMSSAKSPGIVVLTEVRPVKSVMAVSRIWMVPPLIVSVPPPRLPGLAMLKPPFSLSVVPVVMVLAPARATKPLGLAPPRVRLLTARLLVSTNAAEPPPSFQSLLRKVSVPV